MRLGQRGGVLRVRGCKGIWLCVVRNQRLSLLQGAVPGAGAGDARGLRVTTCTAGGPDQGPNCPRQCTAMELRHRISAEEGWRPRGRWFQGVVLRWESFSDGVILCSRSCMRAVGFRCRAV